MKQCEASKGSVRPGRRRHSHAAALLASALIAGPAIGGDRAAIDVIGYSQDSRYFAFEEYGIRDGSGFAYSSIYLIDLSTDRWVIGTPVQITADSEDEPLGVVREAAQAEAGEALSALGVVEPAEFAALLGDGVPDDDGQTLRFGVPGFGTGAPRGDYRLELSSFPARAASPCAEWFSFEPLGYELVIADGDNRRLIHRDSTLPRSRGCPQAYRLYGVVLPFGGTSISDAVALISVYAGGFEGPDRRFVAVPLGL